MYKYYKRQITIRDFLMMYSDIDTQPVGQRLDTELKYESGGRETKAQGIVGSILRGIDLGQITVHECDGEFVYVSIDGGHRKRYIKAFFENMFRVNGKYYRDLSQEEKDLFLNTELTFCIYSNLNVWDIGYIFRSLNKTTDVNHQEMLNSYGDIPIANAVRETVRRVAGINNKFHSLFEYTQRDDKPRNFINLQFDNKRLRIDEIVARIFCRYYDGGGLGRADDKSLEEMYEAELTQKEVQKLVSKVTKCLNFLEDIAEVRKRHNSLGLSQKEFSMFTRIWMYMEEEYGTFKINDIETFYLTVSQVASEFFKPYDNQEAFLREESPFDFNKTKGQQFKDTLTEHRNLNHIKTTLMWLIERLDMKSLVTLKDPQRLFPRDWRENKLAEQGFKCAVDGKPLTMENAQGGHIISHADGGRTIYDNLAMISTEHNRKMGSMSLEKYKELLSI
jgi:5-methylcytosine-specific restriction endonuclease McrA